MILVFLKIRGSHTSSHMSWTPGQAAHRFLLLENLRMLSQEASLLVSESEEKSIVPYSPNGGTAG